MKKESMTQTVPIYFRNKGNDRRIFLIILWDFPYKTYRIISISMQLPVKKCKFDNTTALKNLGLCNITNYFLNDLTKSAKAARESY